MVQVRNGRVRRLVRGTSPAFSPDGHSLAFVAPGHRLMVISATGNHAAARRVGNVRAVSVDWQPKPRGANPGCPVPPGSTVLAKSSTALVTGDGLPMPPLVFSNSQSIA